ncbi:Amastin surface glycoprotein, putative [Leishmania lindenbergi]|uniref:Amastin surface glycoprotein n=1 Tax=Leishmania lindenbergi TaxID=651832 RepID=A0AAW3AT97_9TRYP
MAWSIALLIYVVVQCVALFCLLVATPSDIFRMRNGTPEFPNQCFTLWGFKLDCYSFIYNLFADDQWRPCPARRDRFRVAEGFALISIFVYGAAFVLGVIMMFCCCYLRWVCLALNCFGAVTVCIVWACMVVTYNRDEGRLCPAWRTRATYGAGFFFFLIAWVLDILNIPVLLFVRQDSGAGESGKGTENKAQE